MTPNTRFRPAGAAAKPSAGREPASPRDVPPRAGWRRISRAIRRFEASRAADVVGAGVVAFLVYAVFFVFMGVLG